MLEFERIGHLIANTEQYLRELSLDPEKSAACRSSLRAPANRQALDMINAGAGAGIGTGPVFYMLGLSLDRGTRFDAPRRGLPGEETDFFIPSTALLRN